MNKPRRDVRSSRPASRTARQNRRPKRREGQLALDLPEPSGHGGRRRGAGRKPTGRRKEARHRARPALSRNYPVHVTLRTVSGTWNLRTKRCFVPIHAALSSANEHRSDCRIVHYSVQGNHLHLIVEAEDERALSAGIKGLAVRLARRLNRVMGRRGQVFARYHAAILKTPRQVRNALSYVLNNLRRHAAQWGRPPAEPYTDPFSSAPSFDGWRDRETAWQARATGPPWMAFLPEAVVRARTWLLGVGWRRHGLVSAAEVPGVPGRRS